MADIRFRGARILRAVRAAFRDRDWNSCRIEVGAAAVTADRVRLPIRCDDRGIALHGSLEVRAASEEYQSLAVTLDVVADAELLTNRIGLVVLHPAGVSGSALTVTHPDGTRAETAFPRAISPHQPVIDIAGLEWQSEGGRAELRFEGDVFEMEDQRNWTDASFKTYSRPLALPFPYRVAAGARVRQSIRLDVAPGVRPARPSEDLLTLTAGGEFPAIGLGAATAPDPAPTALERIGSSVLVELDLATPNWRAALERASAGGAPLDVRIVLAQDTFAVLDVAAAALAGLNVIRAAVFWPTGPARHVSDRAATAALREALSKAGVDTAVVGGARSHFTELNRERHRLPPDLDGIVFATTPLFHERSTEQLVESVAMQRLVARQAVSEASGVPVHVGPITLRPRYNDSATTPQPAPTTSSLSDGYGARFTGSDDERQRMPELGSWTVASAAAFAVPGVVSLSYFEEWGPRGVRDASGADYPVAGALRELSGLAGSTLLHGDSPDGLVWAVGALRDGGETVLVSNLDTHKRTVTVETPAGRTAVTVAPSSWLRLG